MRVCIVGTSRSGTTSLMNYVHYSLNLNCIVEPYNEGIYAINRPKDADEFKNWEQPNTVVKHLITQVPKDKLYNLDKYFDKVIVIHRVNLLEASESWLAAENSKSWDRHYDYESSISKIDPLILQDLIQEEVKRRVWLALKIKKLSYFTTTYEDLFIYGKDFNRVKEYLGIKTNEYDYLLDSSRRLRKDSPIKKTLQ